MATFSDPFVTDFLLEKELNEGRRIATLRTYHMAFRILADNPYVDMSDFSTYTELNFKRLLQQCLAERKWSSETYNRMMKNWRMYCRWLSDSGILPENPLSRMKQRAVPRKLPKALDREQVRSMLYALNRIFPASGDYVSERNRTMVYVYLYTGLRLYELVNLRVGDFDPSGEFLRVNDGKWWKDRMVPIVAKLAPSLAKYFPVRDAFHPSTDLAFPTRFGNAMQHREVYEVIKKLRAKLPFNLTCHMLRHTFATELARKQINLFNISRVLWHSNVNTTKIYLNFDVDSIRESINGIDMYE